MSIESRNANSRAINNAYAAIRGMLQDMDDVCAQYKLDGTSFAQAADVCSHMAQGKLEGMRVAIESVRSDFNAMCMVLDKLNAEKKARESELHGDVERHIANILAHGEA